MFENIQELEDFAQDSSDEVLFLEPRKTFDRAIIGFASRAGGSLNVVAYDSDKCIQAMMEDNEWDYEEALEFFEFNTRSAWVGEGTPIFVDRVATFTPVDYDADA